jgi:hypothetical protein
VISTTLVSIFSYNMSLFSYNDGELGGCRMNEELTWQVRDEADERGSRQKAAPKACFYWKRDGQLVRSAEFTQSELEVEIERLNTDVTQFVIALKMLALSRGS